MSFAIMNISINIPQELIVTILLSIVGCDATVLAILGFEEAESRDAAHIMLIKYAGSWVNIYHIDTWGSRLNFGVTSVDLLQRVTL